MKLASHNSLSFVKPRKWWEKLINGEVNFTDIDNGEGTVFVALNNWH